MMLTNKMTMAFISTSYLFSAAAFGLDTNQMIAVGKDGVILTSSDGVQWSKENSLVNTTIDAITRSNDQYTAIGFDYVGYSLVLQSRDGHNWVATDLYSTFRPNTDILWDGKQYIGANASWGSVYTSLDGLSWFERYSAYPSRLGHLAMNDDKNNFISMGGVSSPHACTGYMANSKDAITWTTVSQDLPCMLGGTWGKDQFVVTAVKGGYEDSYEAGILTGLDFKWTWHAVENGAGKTLLSVATNKQIYVAVGRDDKKNNAGIIYSSTDAQKWKQVNISVSATLQKVIWTHKQFIAVGDKGIILTSTDGQNWVLRNSGVTSSLLDVA